MIENTYEVCYAIEIDDLDIGNLVDTSMITCGCGLMLTLGILMCIRILKAA